MTGKCESCHRPLRRSPGPLGPKCAAREAAAAHWPTAPHRRSTPIPGQTVLNLDTEPQETP